MVRSGLYSGGHSYLHPHSQSQYGDYLPKEPSLALDTALVHKSQDPSFGSTGRLDCTWVNVLTRDTDSV